MKKKQVPAAPAMSAEEKAKIHRIMMFQNFDLRGVQNKVGALRSTELCTGWALFLNKERTLAHIMHREDVEESTYTRMKIPYGLHGCHPEYILKIVHDRMVKRFII